MRERFNTVAVAIPAQLFHVRCHVSLDRQVPVMTDFAVRLLHLSGPLEVSALREYFGLAPSELRDLIASLREEGLVGEVNGRISLTSYAEARFTASPDGLPRFTRITERQSRPVFELLTYSPLPKSLSSVHWDNALPLDWTADDPSAGRTVEQAEAAFHRYFQDIERLEQEDVRRRAYSCYKVDEVRAGRPFNIPFPVHFDVDIEGNVEFEIDAQLDLLPESLRSRVRTLTADRIAALNPRNDRLRSFVEYFNDDLLTRYLIPQRKSIARLASIQPEGKIAMRNDPSIEFGRYIHEVHGQGDGLIYDEGQSRALLGALYMQKCKSRLLDGVQKALAIFKKSSLKDAASVTDVFWVIPDSELWGRTDFVRKLLEDVRNALSESLKTSINIVCIAPYRKEEGRDRAGKRALHLLNAGFSQAILSTYIAPHECFEAFLIPNVLCAATYQWPVPSADRYTVPLGFVSHSQVKIQKTNMFVQSVLQSSMYQGMHKSGDTNENRKFIFEEASVTKFAYLDKYTKPF